ncbi:MAG TPA: helix-turn-helix transcriptional regulator, partial [Agromyces sp.]
MAVREALLALLLGGPAYGFQLHGALASRTGGRRRINVGQSYATLERATKSGLIESAGTTDDGLPLHRLTEAGTALALGWLGGADAAGAEPWDETIDRVLIAASLPEIDERPILDAELGRWG